MSFADHFSSTAGAYAAARPTYPERLYRFIASHAPARRVAWDCATGSGQAARDLARDFDRVVATDASEAQIVHAVRCEGVDYCVMRAEETGLGSGSIDVVTAAAALHWFDFDAFYREVRRLLVPDGLLVAWCYGSVVLPPPMGAIVRDFEYGSMGPYWPAERAFVIEGYRTIPFPFREVPGPALDIRADYTLGQLMGYVSTWSATKAFREREGRDPLPALEQRLAAVWGDPSTVRQARWPLHLRAGRAD